MINKGKIVSLCICVLLLGGCGNSVESDTTAPEAEEITAIEATIAPEAEPVPDEVQEEKETIIVAEDESEVNESETEANDETETDAESTEIEGNNTTEESSDVSDQSTDWQTFLTDYEAWMNNYIDLMQKYNDNPEDIEILTDYTNMMAELVTWTESAQAIEGDLADDPEALAEYLRVQARILEKLNAVTY